MSKIGLHLLIGSRTGYGNFLQTTVSSGSYRPIIKCVGDFAPAREAKAVFGNRVLTIGRLTGYGWEGFDDYASSGSSPEYIAAVAAHVFETFYRPKIEDNPLVDVWEPSNEWSWWWDWQASWYIALAPHFEAYGKSMGVFACSTGNPPDATYPDIARCCRELKARNAGHILTLHEYGLPDTLRGSTPYHALRYRRLYEFLQQHDAVIPLVISESGQNNGCCFVGTEAFIDDYEWYDDYLMRDDYVLGCAAWTLGRWAGANFQEALPALADYIVAHPALPPMPYRTYLPFVSRGASYDNSLWGLAVSAGLGGLAWIIRRRIKAKKNR